MPRKLSIAFLITLLVALTAGTTGANPSQASSALDRAPGVTYAAALSTGQPMTPAGSGFTYQGRLLDGGNPANGTYDLRFTLFDALTGGNQVGSPLTLSSQTVTSGLFTVTLDFGTLVFRGDARFLQIEVQHNGGGFVLLAPRQPLTPAPYAMSLMPGAVISATTTSNVLTALNNGAGVALKGTGSGGSGVEGDSTSGNGVAGYTSSSTSAAVGGLNFGSGPGVAGVSVNGAGVSASSINGIGVSANSTNSTAVNAQGKTAGVYGVGTDVGAAGVWGVANSGTGAAGLYGYSTSGYGAQGISSAVNGTGVYGVDNNAGATGVAGSSTSGNGVAGSSTSGNGGTFTSTSASGVFATGTNGVFANGTAPDGAGLWGNANNGTGAAGVYGTSTSGYGAWGVSTAASGAGVQGQTTVVGGTGVKAVGNGSNSAALLISNGAVRVANAGNETNSIVFEHTVYTGTGGNVCNGGTYTILDNPYSNGDPNAILLVTPKYYFQGFTQPVYVYYNLPGQLQTCPSDKWLAGNYDGTFTNLVAFNVMVIKP